MYKKLLLLFLIVFTIASCKKDNTSNYAKFSGKYLYPNSEYLTLKGNGYTKKIKLNKDGVFSDTLHLQNTASHYLLTDGDNELIIYLKNGDDLDVKLSSINFLKSLEFSGLGSETNNYLAKKAMIGKESFNNTFFELDEEQFDTELENIFSKFSQLLKEFNNIDTDLAVLEKKEILSLKKAVKQQYLFKKSLGGKYKELEGKACPNFDHYINYNGSRTSLNDFRGKYIYIDLWATWCTPCRAEIPHLKRLENEFKGENIIFVSISIDKKSAYKAWKTMIETKNMSGTQLFSNGDKQFIQNLKVNSIPRFVIVDPKGNIINAEAPRPSNPKTKEILNKILK